tara:strand:- start:346 stop:1179 length:834 start_codon:yes stop_codon:yes gene_type:complete
MPEGPEIKRAGDKISKVLVGKQIIESNFYYERIKNKEEFVKNKNVKEITTRGKAMLIRFNNDWTMYSHNQLYGKWTINLNTTKIKSKRALRVIFKTKKHSVRLWSATDIDLLPTPEENKHSFLKKIGPDVLNETCSFELIKDRLISKDFQKKKASTLMLDQAVFAGLGNYLRSEILFDAKIHPEDRPIDLDKTRIIQWAKSIKEITHLAYKTGGFTVSNLIADINRKKGERRKSYRHAVFMRYKYECINCNSRIERRWYGNRKLDFCPRCQVQKRKI